MPSAPSGPDLRSSGPFQRHPDHELLPNPQSASGLPPGSWSVGDVISEGHGRARFRGGRNAEFGRPTTGAGATERRRHRIVDQVLLGAKFEYEDSAAMPQGVVRTGPSLARGLPASALRAVLPPGSKLTPFVNREEEIALLLMRWQEAKERDGQVVLLSGEPGIGKSRIVQEFRERIASEPHGRVSFQCSPYYTSTAFYPFIEQLKSTMGFDREGPSELSLQALRQSLAVTDASGIGNANICGVVINPHWRSIQVLGSFPTTAEGCDRCSAGEPLVGLARDEPVAMIFEDAHWIDPTSREVLDLLVDRVQDTSILILITCRSEFRPSWNADSHITTLTLNGSAASCG